jgi:hypothetical protein
LTTYGILLARHLPTPAVGNFTAIALGAMIVFLLAGHRPAAADKVKKVLPPRFVCLALVLLLAVHLNGTLRRTSAESIMQSNIRKALAQEIAKIPGVHLVDVTLVRQNGKTFRKATCSGEMGSGVIDIKFSGTKLLWWMTDQAFLYLRCRGLSRIRSL